MIDLYCYSPCRLSRDRFKVFKLVRRGGDGPLKWSQMAISCVGYTKNTFSLHEIEKEWEHEAPFFLDLSKRVQNSTASFLDSDLEHRETDNEKDLL